MERVVNKFSHKEVISPIDTKSCFIGNYKCHFNVLSYYFMNKNKVKSIVGGIQVFEDKQGVAHFIVELKDGTHIDPTFGNVTSFSYRYFIPIERYKPDTFNPNRELTNLEHYLHRQLPFWLRLFIDKNNM